MKENNSTKETVIIDTRQIFEETSIETFKGFITSGENLPQSFAMSRTLIQDRIEYGEEEYNEITTITGESIPDFIKELQSINKNVPSKTIIGKLLMTLGKQLYNISYQNNNMVYCTGIARKTLSDGRTAPVGKYKDMTGHTGEICVKLNDLVRDVYGIDRKTSGSEKKEILSTLHAMEAMYVKTNMMINGYEEQKKMIVIDSIYTHPNTGEKTLRILFHPIFAIGIKKNFTLHPQDIMDRLKGDKKRKITDRAIDLLFLLSVQRTDQPFTIYLDTLVEKLNLQSVFKKNRKRGQETLDRIIDDMVNVGKIKRKPRVIKKGATDKNPKYIFTFNPDYAKGQKGNEPG